MKLTPRILGLSLITLLAVYAGPVKSGDGATSANNTGDPKPPATQPVNAVSAVNDTGRLEIHVNDTSVLAVLRMLSLQGRINIVASGNVTGNVSANLYDVTVREALDAILQANGYVYREKGNCIYVYTARELANLDKSPGATATHLDPTFPEASEPEEKAGGTRATDSDSGNIRDFVEKSVLSSLGQPQASASLDESN